MILQALVQLAENEKLIADPDFEFKPVAWVVRLKEDGTLITIDDNRENLYEGQLDRKGKSVKAKWVGRKALVPIQFVRTSGDAAFFAVDKSDYVFGVTAAKPNRLNLFYDQLSRCLTATDDPSVKAAVAFGKSLANRPPDTRAALLPKDLVAGDLIAFRVDSNAVLLHDRSAVTAYWKSMRDQPIGGTATMSFRRCLISWKLVGDVPLFRKVKNMPGDASGGLSLVSFNASAWESYGWTGEDNAPVSREPAEAAVTALSRLLNPRPMNGLGENLPVRRIRLSDDTAVVFWSPEPSLEAQGILNALPVLFDPPDDVTDVGNLFTAVRTGVMKELTTPAAFYAMTLTAVTGRIVVRDWLASTVADLQANLRQHFDDLDCVRNTFSAKGHQIRGVMRLDELMSSLAAPGREAKIPTSLAAAFVRAAFRGSAYPFAILQRALLRERAEAGGDDWIDSVRRDARAALLKAVLNRRLRFDQTAVGRYSEVNKNMDPTNTNIGYNLGALLAVLERLQAAALNDVNASIVDKYFSAASATPRNAFDRLLRNARHHAKKAQGDDKTAGQAYGLERLIDELVSRFHAPTVVVPPGVANPKRMPTPPAVGLPVSLDLEQQGLFVIGYHHMRRYLWMSRDERDAWQSEHPDAPAAFVRKRSDKAVETDVAA